MTRGRMAWLATAIVLAAASGFGQTAKPKASRPATPKAPAAATGDAGVTVTERDGGVKQFRFTETDIEGRLKAPQLVYFLRRVLAEIAAGDLGHRSFMRELSETRRDPNF